MKIKYAVMAVALLSGCAPKPRPIDMEELNAVRYRQAYSTRYQTQQMSTKP